MLNQQQNLKNNLELDLVKSSVLVLTDIELLDQLSFIIILLEGDSLKKLLDGEEIENYNLSVIKEKLKNLKKIYLTVLNERHTN
ncbi:MAG: hypothetical protein WC979_00865 [Candidatus Pacearchaeota archaeon]|jgi:hypothetical protein|nr:hypothetical protein [Clostridia bacterium]